MCGRVQLAGGWLLVVLTSASGCATFKTDGGADQAHAAAKRQVEGRTTHRDDDVKRASFEPADAKQEASLGISSLSPENIGKGIQHLTGTAPDQDQAKKLYLEAEAQFREASAAPEGKRDALYSAAGEKYRLASIRWPDSALEQDALFMAGESYFFADRLTKANEFYEKLAKKHENSRHSDQLNARRFAIAQYWLELDKAKPLWSLQYNMSDKTRPGFDTFGNAVRLYDKIRLHDPTGKLADDATLAAANAHFVAGRYMDAAEFYDDLRRTFPGSEHQFRAHFLGLKAKLLSYQGPHYDGAALDDAEKLITQIRRQFKAEAQQEEEFIKLAYAEVRFKKAEREWKMASYYDARAEYGGARQYYNLIVKDYGDTPFSDKARTRLEEIKDLPDVPPQIAPALVNLFPAANRRDPLKPRPGPNMLQRLFQPAPPKRPATASVEDDQS